MRSRRWATRLAWGAAIVVGLGAAGLVCQRVGARGRYATAYSTYGAGADGTRGLYLLTEQLGARPQRWAEDLGRLPAQGGMLVALGSCEETMRRPVGRLERARLLEWVRGGGVLVVAGVPDYVEPAEFGVALVADPLTCRPTEGLIGMLARAEERRRQDKRPDDAEDPDRTDLEELSGALEDDPVGTFGEVTAQEGLPDAEPALGVGEPFAGLGEVGLRRALAVEVDEERPHHTLLRLGGPEGPPAAVRVDVGEGAVIALSSASLFANRDLSEQRGGLLFARLVREYAPGGPVLFDEYHLGVGERRSLVRYLRQVGAAALIVQLLLLVFLVIWRLAARFGAPREDAVEAPLGTASYVEGVGALYAGAKDAAGATEVLVRRALERIALHHRIDRRDAESLADGLEARARNEAAKAVRALAVVRPSRGLARLAGEVDALVARALADGSGT